MIRVIDLRIEGIRPLSSYLTRIVAQMRCDNSRIPLRMCKAYIRMVKYTDYFDIKWTVHASRVKSRCNEARFIP